jgi:hypothetical protein
MVTSRPVHCSLLPRNARNRWIAHMQISKSLEMYASKKALRATIGRSMIGS